MAASGARTLDGIAVLEDMEPEARRALVERCRWHEFAEHEQIIDRASEGNDVYFVVRGMVRVVNYSYAGREVSYDDIGSGGLFGELAAIDGAPRSATVVALADTETAAISPDLFLSLLHEHPEIAIVIIRRLVQVVRGSTDRIMDLSTLGAVNRIHAELLRLAGPVSDEDDSAEIRPLPVHADIASRAGTTRESVARTIGDLARKGIVRKESHALVILDLERLRDLVDEA